MKNYTQFLGSLLLVLVGLNLTQAQEDKSFLLPPMLVKNNEKSDQYLPEQRASSGISSLAVSRGGRFWAVWYAGITPGKVERCPSNYIVVATSDEGETWTEVLYIDPDGPGPVRAFDPEVWVDPDGHLWVFWAQQIKPATSTISGVWAIKTTEANTGDPEWSKPMRLTDGVMMCKPIVLTTGEWVLPVSYWHETQNSAMMMISANQGANWEERGAVDVPEDTRDSDEHVIVERMDGTLWMLVRTKYGIGESFSKDHGKTWSPLLPSKIQHPTSRIFITRLSSGSLLLVKHGPIDMKIGRSHLMSFISKDDGRTWSNGLLLDERPGVSYPDGQQTSDGRIYITYDYKRSEEQKILMTSFTEDDILSGTDSKILEVFRHRNEISKGGKLE